ncbi:T9SS type A sorting domain-containing protein [Flavobacterium sp. '19STA2R22 D10 B1']|uniref:T9SS type A sorting domain-containing protein n=1 Tax=Flavobacterium aerium TaxID=3037261 RepID=UPI00278C58D5|nr:T9SS type A sorting domain-containing protein [Flavobacterium sp. '19STA2R22 D10 B1']
MKNKILFLFMFAYGMTYSQTTALQFNYDSAGNQITRKICINCMLLGDTFEKYETLETISEDDYFKEDISLGISYYPNPVVEELYIKWENTRENQVISITLFSMNGQQIKMTNNLQNVELSSINFRDYSIGHYNLVMLYSNGEKKTLKIIKQ